MKINGQDYSSNEPALNNRFKQDAVKNSSASWAKIFGYMFAGLAITAGVSFLLGYIFSQWIISAGQSATNTINVILIVSSIALIIMSFVVSLSLLKGKHSILVPALIYVILMGVLLSTFTMFIDWRILGLAFAVTSGTFGIMALIGALSKGNLSGLALIAMGLFLGAAVCALVSWIFIFTNPSVASTMVWIVDFVTFGAVMLLTTFDVWNIKRIIQSGEMSDNLALYCAFTLYVDFIYLFIKIVYYLAIIFGRSR